jgi:SAM-dependent methyltransferase
MSAMPVNPVAAKGFQSAAGAYVRGRPSYPPQAIDWLAGQCALGPGATVLDVAAGTGKLTQPLVARGATVIAVEPVAAMREALAATLPGVAALDGTAEALPVADATADTITVGQAYHWFAGEPALAEFARVLGVDGRLALIWNVRDLDQPLWRGVSALIDPLSGEAPRHGSGRWRESLRYTSHFRPVAEARFASEQLADHAAVLDRVGSISYIAAMPDGERAALLEQIAGLAAQEPEPIALRYVTEAYVLAPVR